MERIKLQHINKFILLWMILVISMLVACKQITLKKPKLLDDYPSIEISASMGDSYKMGYMSLIGNLGYLVDKNADTTEVLIISQRIEPGITVNYNPIGVLVLENSGKKQHIIVATTPNDLYTSVEIKDLSDLSVHFGNVKRIIEQWYNGLNGLGESRVIKWEGKKYLTDILND